MMLNSYEWLFHGGPEHMSSIERTSLIMYREKFTQEAHESCKIKFRRKSSASFEKFVLQGDSSLRKKSFCLYRK